MGEILTLLWQYKSLIVISLLALALAVSGAYISLLKKEKLAADAYGTAIKAQLDVSQASVVTLEGSIKGQNEKINVFEHDAEIRLATNTDLLKKAKVSADLINKQADDILSRKQPKDTTACLAALDIINGEIRNAK